MVHELKMHTTSNVFLSYITHWTEPQEPTRELEMETPKTQRQKQQQPQSQNYNKSKEGTGITTTTTTAAAAAKPLNKTHQPTKKSTEKNTTQSDHRDVSSQQQRSQPRIRRKIQIWCDSKTGVAPPCHPSALVLHRTLSSSHATWKSILMYVSSSFIWGFF